MEQYVMLVVSPKLDIVGVLCRRQSEKFSQGQDVLVQVCVHLVLQCVR